MLSFEIEAPYSEPYKDGASWKPGTLTGLRKMHRLQGPIDDAFMDAFVFVLPTGRPLSEGTGKWAREQADYAISEWVHFFRGEPRVRNDGDISSDDIANNNLALLKALSGDLESSISLYEDAQQRFGRDSSYASLGYAYGMAGRTEEARGVLASLKDEAARRPVSAYMIALVHLGLDEREAALEQLRAAVKAHDDQ